MDGNGKAAAEKRWLRNKRRVSETGNDRERIRPGSEELAQQHDMYTQCERNHFISSLITSSSQSCFEGRVGAVGDETEKESSILNPFNGIGSPVSESRWMNVSEVG